VKFKHFKGLIRTRGNKKKPVQHLSKNSCLLTVAVCRGECSRGRPHTLVSYD